MHGRCEVFIVTSIDTTVNSILREWRDLWPGGLCQRDYSVLNLMAQCRGGGLGYNRAECDHCGVKQWFPSSCGDRHCPMCLGPRQAQWSENVCGRLPDCPHFHVVFTLPEELRGFFESNYRVAAGEFFAAAAETLESFMRNNWRMRGGFLAVLHTWGSELNWHPHLHVLACAGGADTGTGEWRQARANYMFPVKSMSAVFRAVMLRRLEALEAPGDAGAGDGSAIRWPPDCGSVEERRAWRVGLARRNWNIFSRPTLGNTRAVVRYLARYTSRIAISNARVLRVDEEERTVCFQWKDYRNGGTRRETTLGGKEFIRRFTRHLVPKGLRRVRYFGIIAGRRGACREIPGSPRESIAEKAAPEPGKPCAECGSLRFSYRYFYIADPAVVTRSEGEGNRFSLGGLEWTRAGPGKGVQQADADGHPSKV